MHLPGKPPAAPQGTALPGLRSGFSLWRAMGQWTGLAQVRCPVCGRPTDSVSALGLCPDCNTALAPRSAGHCPQCGVFFSSEHDTPMLCGSCRADPPPWNRFLLHGRYQGPLRDLIVNFKFHGGIQTSNLLGRLAASAWQRAFAGFLPYAPELLLPELVVPVPLHPRRLRGRGFNQSRILARPIARTCKVPLADSALQRIRNTPPQSTLKAAERRTNLRHAFAASPLVQGRRILLVDDVCTTGATLRECARSLQEAGADRVDVLVVARA